MKLYNDRCLLTKIFCGLFLLWLAIFFNWYSQPVQIQRLKKLPLSVSTFKKLIEDDYVYVDKTESIYSLIQSGRHYFLVRPRRFGRTLFLSTLQEIFSGNKQLFQDCWICRCGQYSWPVHPVVTLNFLLIDDSTPRNFEANLLYEIYFLAEQRNIILSKNLSLENAVAEFIKKLSEQGEVVLLIDEYDKPMRKYQCDKQAMQRIEQTLKVFYKTLGLLDDYFRAIIITGVVPYSASMLFSAIPHLKNISASCETNKLCGFTRDELLTTLFPYVEQCALQTNKLATDILHELQVWYGGYRFIKTGCSLYSPIPVFYYLYEMQHGPYWLETSTPSFLVQLIKNFPNLFYHQESWEFRQLYGENCEIGGLSASMALLYAGYLTLHPQQNDEQGVALTFPNRGAQEGFDFLLANT